MTFEEIAAELGIYTPMTGRPGSARKIETD
jgi:hypothetical protein